VSLSFDFGDGTTQSGASVAHAFTTAASFNVTVTATDAAGNQTTTTRPIAITPVATAPAPSPVASTPRNTTAPSTSGSPRVGATLVCSTGAWTGTAPISYGYRWLSNGSPIAGATGSSYAAVAANVGHTVACAVTATNVAGSASAQSTASRITAAPACAGFSGTALRRCIATNTFKAAVTKCDTIKTTTRAGRKRKTACVATANLAYKRALAAAKCPSVKNAHQRATCVARARKIKK
jgi:hypothetical protein